MAKKIEWLDNFAENFAKKNVKVASKVVKEDVIINKYLVKGASNGSLVKLNGKIYKIADIDYVDNKGDGVLLTEVNVTDPMSMEMGTNGVQPSDKSQEYARTNPGDIYDLDVRSQEQVSFESAANATSNAISNDSTIDRTTVDGRYTAPSSVDSAPAPIAVEETPAIEEEKVEEAPTVEDEKIEEAPTAEDEKIEEPVAEEENEVKIATLKTAEDVAKAVELEAEDILEDVEDSVKEICPNCNVKEILEAIEDALDKEGIEVVFQKEVEEPVEGIKCASAEMSNDEIMDIVKEVVDAVVEYRTFVVYAILLSNY